MSSATLDRPAAPTSPARQQPEPGARRDLGLLADRWAPWLLALLAVVLRLPFMTRTLYAFDSANYALAVRDFYNVAFHQPHPPGYPLYVAFARVFDVFVHDANRSLVLEGICLSAIAVFATSVLARRLFGSVAGVLAGLLLLFTVGFWGYGEVAYPYVGLAAEAATLALLAHVTIGGRTRVIVALGAAWAIALGIRWDGAIFCAPLWLWALCTVNWRWRALSVAVAGVIVLAFAIPMVQLSGGWAAYTQAINSYLGVWAPQSAFVGDTGGGSAQANYNLNFLIDYLRQMLGVGILLILYVLGRRFGPARLASDERSRFLLVWTAPPILEYIFAHLGEAGYVLSLAPQAAILITIGILDLHDEIVGAVRSLTARGWTWLPSARILATLVASALVLAIVGWNTQAFARGVGPGRLPDLKAHDATTGLQVAYVQQQPPAATLVLAHDIYRQVQFYLPGYQDELMYSEYVPNFETARITTPLRPGITQAVVLDSPLNVPASDAARVRQVVLSEQPRVQVWLVDLTGATAIEHGYQYLHVVGG